MRGHKLANGMSMERNASSRASEYVHLKQANHKSSG